MLVENWKVYNSKSDCFIWILLCSFSCSHILHFQHVLLCCLIDKGTLLEYTVNQQVFTFGETIDKGSLSERQLTRGHFWRDNWQKKALQLTRGNLKRDNQLTRGQFQRDNWQGGTFGDTIDRGHFKRDNRLTREAFLERFYNTDKIFLKVLLLLVNHCSRPSHIKYALYLFLSCLSEDRFVWYSQNSSFENQYVHFAVLIADYNLSNLILYVPCIFFFCAPF